MEEAVMGSDSPGWGRTEVRDGGNRHLQNGFPATESCFSVLRYGSHWYIKQEITTNQLIAMNSKVQVKFVNEIYPV